MAWVIGIAEPFGKLYGSLAFSLFHGLQKVPIALDSATIFRRAGSSAVHACRQFRQGCRPGLDQGKRVLPIVPKIILIVDRMARLGQELVQGAFPLIDDHRVVEVEARVREGFVLEGKLVQVAVGPPHAYLDDGMNPAEVGIGRNQKDSPNLTLGMVQTDLDE